MKQNAKKFILTALDFQNIRILANSLYKHQGKKEGKALDHWLEAERQLSENLFFDKVLMLGSSPLLTSVTLA